MAPDIEEHLELAKELDGMEREISSWEVDFLENVLKRLRAGRSLSAKQQAALMEMHAKYFGDDPRTQQDPDTDPDEDDFA